MEQEILSGLMEIQRWQAKKKKKVITPSYKSSFGKSFVSCSDQKKKKRKKLLQLKR